MKTVLLIAAVACMAAVLPSHAAPAAGARIFPFAYQVDDLSNGLRVVTVPLPYPDLVAFWAIVRAGSRNEVEPGKSGFAHFFEHMMFRGTDKYPPEKYNEILKVMGAEHNAFTSDDVTAYHVLFGKKDLEQVMEMEADRFQNLKYPEGVFRTEAKAVLGEYNKNSANPIQKIFEQMRDVSFTTHTYKHTTMGFIKDIEAMPDQYTYSKTFFDRFYRPENVVLLAVGDVQRDQVLAYAKKYWGAWKRGTDATKIPVEPEPAGPYTTQIDWPSSTLPWVAIGYRGPAWSDEKPDMAALDLAAAVAFSESSPLYRKLVIEDQTVDTLASIFADRRDPGLLIVAARVKDVKDVESVKAQILETIAGLGTTPPDDARLAAVKANIKYSLALSMDNTESVASSLASYIQLSGSPDAINRTFALYDSITPQTVMQVSRTYFTDKRRTIATLATKGQLPAAAASSGASAAAAATSTSASTPVSKVRQLLRPAEVPLVSVRVLFDVGAANDPQGKEGLAALTASLMAEGSTRTKSYDQIVQAFYPMATSVGAQVDKEMTVFSGTTHADNLEAFRSLMFSMILEPGWKEEDFNRVKDDAINFLKVNLRGNNDEELGKEALYLSLYGPDHPYGHQNVGTVTSLESITLEDVKGFYAKHYTAANVTLGLAGGYPAGFPEKAAAALGRLPAGASSKLTIPQAPTAAGQRLEIVQKETRATAISMGFPLDVTRRDADWAALWLAASYLGQHRSSNGVLYQRLREVRGLNYGDYAYTEYFPRGMFQFQPDMNLGRQRQIFQIWIRPVEPANAHFALRAALFELKKLIDQGISQEDFENTRSFLDKYIPVLQKTQSLQLGSALDGQYYGTGDFAVWARGKLAALTRDDVNRAIRKHWSLQNMMIEIITKDGEALRKAIVGNSPSPITYNAPKPAEVMNEDKRIADFPLSIKPENARVVDVDSIFEK